MQSPVPEHGEAFRRTRSYGVTASDSKALALPAPARPLQFRRVAETLVSEAHPSLNARVVPWPVDVAGREARWAVQHQGSWRARRRLQAAEPVKAEQRGIEMTAFHAHIAYGSHLTHLQVGTKLGDAVARVCATVRTWCVRASTRRELRTLDDQLLADIGMSRTEVTKPFWQA